MDDDDRFEHHPCSRCSLMLKVVAGTVRRDREVQCGFECPRLSVPSDRLPS